MTGGTNTDYDGMYESFMHYKLNMPVSRYSQRHSLAELLGDVTGKTVLDVGCGFGYHGTPVKKRGAKDVLGFDYSKEEVEYARTVLEKREPTGMRFVHGDATGDWAAFGVREGQWDLAICMQVLIHLTVEGVEAVFAGAGKALKGGGRFVGSVPMPQPMDVAQRYSFTSDFDPAKHPPGAEYKEVYSVEGVETFRTTNRFISKEHLREAARKAGFANLVFHPPKVSPEGLAAMPAGWWDEYVAKEVTLYFEAAKA